MTIKLSVYALTVDQIRDHIDQLADGVMRGERTMLVAEDEEGIVGTVQLITEMPENQPHRADVAKLLVHRRARGGGIGQKLMEAVEDAAREDGRRVLVLDTASSTAERLYERRGWQRVVPDYALMPDGGVVRNYLLL
jgi:GNAT superfamily N-acetyltransferase